MIQPKHLIIFPLLFTTLIFLISGSVVFGLLFALIFGLMYADFLRRELSASRDNEDKEQASAENQGQGSIEEDYRILGLKPGAAIAEVRSVYKNLAAQFHPDTGVHLSEAQRKTSEEAFLKIREAHDRIIDSRRKN